MNAYYVCSHCNTRLKGVDNYFGYVPAHTHFGKPCQNSLLLLINGAQAVYPEGDNYEIKDIEYEGVLFEDEEGETHKVVHTVTTHYKLVPGKSKRTPGSR